MCLLALTVFPIPFPFPLGGGPHLVGAGARADTDVSSAGITLDFDRFATFDLPGGSIPGNSVLLTIAPGVMVPHIESVALRAAAIPQITITGESSTSSIPSLHITRSGNNVTLSWLDPARAYTPLSRQTFDESWQTVLEDVMYAGGVASLTLDASTSASQFFTLFLSEYGD
jgi:hypothetical protein